MHAIPRQIKGINGQSGSGDLRVGKRGHDTVVNVPVGTIVREIWRGDPSYIQDKMSSHSKEELDELRQARAWIHFPGFDEANRTHPLFIESDKELKVHEAKLCNLYNPKSRKPIEVDLDQTYKDQKVLIANGGVGGYGNPAFVSNKYRSPKFGRRGEIGDHLKVALELKLLADVGLVGFPNAGKSSLLKALTNSKTRIANYAFTTLKPEIGVVSLKTNDNEFETNRFTLLDNPGLIEDASFNKGLGHTFLRAVERSLVLVYVIDFSNNNHLNDLKVLINELNQYKSGLSKTGIVIVANKADLFGGTEDEDLNAKKRLEEFKKEVEILKADGSLHNSTTVIPISAKYNLNLDYLKHQLSQNVDIARKSI